MGQEDSQITDNPDDLNRFCFEVKLEERASEMSVINHHCTEILHIPMVNMVGQR